MKRNLKEKPTKDQMEPAELLEFKSIRFTHEVQEILKIYNITVQIDSKQMEKLFNDIIDVEQEVVKKELDTTRGKILVRMDGTGEYRSIKNIRLHLFDLLDFCFNLIQTEKWAKPIVAAIFLKKFLEQLAVNMEEEQIAVCISLYKATKQYTVTDDNITEHIAQELKDSDYCELSIKEIYKALSELIKMGIINIDEGKYEVTEEIGFAD